MENVCTEENDDRQKESSSKRFIPTWFTSELRVLTSLAWPVALSSFFVFAPSPIALIFCGHLGKNDLAAAALAISVLNVTGVFICVGLSTACDTLFAQAYGGKNLRLLSVYFQRSLIIISLSTLVCWSFHLNAERFLLLLHQDPVVSRLAGEYLLCFMPGLIFNFIYQVSIRFLQTQNVVIPTMVFGFLGNIFNATAQYVMVYVLHLGTRGSAAALALSWAFSCLMAIAFIVNSRLHRDSWEGWSLKALDDWGGFLKLALGGLVMVIAEWCVFEGGVFLSGLLGIVEQGAIAISFQIEWGLYMLVLGFAIACSIRVGQNLGSGDSDGAKTSYRVAQITACCMLTVTTTILVILKDVIPMAFTNDGNIRDLVSRLIPLVGFVQITNSVTAISAGGLRGCGLHWIGGILNTVGYIVVVLPVSVVLMFHAGLGAIGFWWAMVAGLVPLTALYIITMIRLDWGKQGRKAIEKNNATTSSVKSSLKPHDEVNGAIELSVASPKPQNENASLLDKKAQRSEQRKRCLIIKRCVACTVLCLVFVTSILLRVFLPSPQ